jgi:aquaporin Z
VNERGIVPMAVAEFLGPFALVFAGVGSILLTRGQDIVAIALAHGLAIGLMIMAVGHISGGHFNPAVTISMLATGRIKVNRAVVYIVAQLLGAVVAAGALTLIYPDLGDFGRNTAGVNLGLPALGPGITTTGAFLMEIVLTFFLVFVIFGVAVDPRTPRIVSGLVIGLTISMDILAGGVVSGAVMNPARWFGPALVQGDFTNFWLWIVGPIIGGLIAAFVYQFVFLADAPALATPDRPDPVVPPQSPGPGAAPLRRKSRR